MKLPDGVCTRWRYRIEPGEGNVAMAEFRVGNRDVPLPPEHSLADAATRVLCFCLPHTKIIFDDSAKTLFATLRTQSSVQATLATDARSFFSLFRGPFLCLLFHVEKFYLEEDASPIVVVDARQHFESMSR